MALTKCSTSLFYSGEWAWWSCLSHSAFFVVEDLDPRLTLSNAFFLISFRSALAPVLSASFFNNMLYYLQVKGMNVLSENMTLTNPIAEQKYNQALNSALAQGTNSAKPASWQPTACTPLCNSNLCYWHWKHWSVMCWYWHWWLQSLQLLSLSIRHWKWLS